jgi:hydrogenase expression/formation protein HypE
MSPDFESWSCPLPLAGYPEIVMSHGGGGRLMADLIQHLFLPALDNPFLRALGDQAVLPLGEGGGRLAFTTDAYVVRPLFFPGGDVGSLAVHGTVNDLAMGGAWPLALSAALVLEEGLLMEELGRIVTSMAAAAEKVGVPVVTGDTKVVEHGHGDGCYVVTSGIGWVPAGVDLGPHRIGPGDRVIVSGPIGRHGIAVLSYREGLGFESDVESDTAPLHDLVRTMLRCTAGGAARDARDAGDDAISRLHALRDPTRGGVAAVLCEMATQAGVGIDVDERRLPVPGAVHAACEMLGLDPLHVANEGILVAFVHPDDAELVLGAMLDHPLGGDACDIGSVVEEHQGRVTMRTPIGGTRIVDRPLGEQLPRIC